MPCAICWASTPDVALLLPPDKRKEGFDNDAAHLQVSPSFLDQYLLAGRKVAQQAVGNAKAQPVSTTYGTARRHGHRAGRRRPGRVPAYSSSIRKACRLGTRGGISFVHDFPAAGEYALTIGDLASGRQIPRMEFSNTVIALLDGKEIHRATVGGERDQKGIDQWQERKVDEINARLRDIRFHAPAGQHTVAVTFLKRANIRARSAFPPIRPRAVRCARCFCRLCVCADR